MTSARAHVHQLSRFSLLLPALRAYLAALHYHWFVEGVAPADDPLASLSPQDWSDLPVWHPQSQEK